MNSLANKSKKNLLLQILFVQLTNKDLYLLIGLYNLDGHDKKKVDIQSMNRIFKRPTKYRFKYKKKRLNLIQKKCKLNLRIF